MSYTERNCDKCGKSYKADNRNLKRGWGLCCSKSCAASKREKSKPTYDPKRVARNNVRRLFWNDSFDDLERDKREFNPDDFEHPCDSYALGQD